MNHIDLISVIILSIYSTKLLWLYHVHKYNTFIKPFHKLIL